MLVGQSDMPTDCFSWFCQNLTSLTSVIPSNLMALWNKASLRRNRPKNSQNSVWQRRKLVEQNSKWVGRLPHQLYRKLRHCPKCPPLDLSSSTSALGRAFLIMVKMPLPQNACLPNVGNILKLFPLQVGWLFYRKGCF